MKKGFTLIEIMVVIGIIGILAGVTLTFLNSARGKSKDASIMQMMKGLQTEMFLESSDHNFQFITNWSDSNSPATDCRMFFRPGIRAKLRQLATAIKELNGDPACLGDNGSCSGNLICKSNASSYCVFSKLPSDKTKSFCVDAVGFSGVVNTGEVTNTCNYTGSQVTFKCK